MKKNLISIVLFLFSILFIPQVYAMNLESISIINASDSYKGGNPSIVGNGTNNVVVTYNAADLKIVPKDLDIGRTIDAAWIGAKIVAPKDIEIQTLKTAVYKSGNSAEQSFWNSQDTPVDDRNNQGKEHYIYVYGAVTEDKLKEATIGNKMISYTWTFDWDKNGDIDQTVTMKINPTGIVLKAEDTDTVLWNFSKYEEIKQASEQKPEQDPAPKTGNTLTYGFGFITLLLSGFAIRKFEK